MKHCPPLRSRPRALFVWAVALSVAFIAFFGSMRDAKAIPSFARKYQTSCITCHTVFPMLNPFGEAFRRNGFRFPSQGGSVDSDAIKADTIALGQDEYKKTFPNSVWPDTLMQGVPLAIVANAGTAVNLPGSGARDAAGNTFAWNDFVGEIAIFGAGAFNDTLTYFTALSVAPDGVGIERAYLLWNDIAGPPHLFNISVGRILPTLHSWGPHSSYSADLFMPSVVTGALYNGSAPPDDPFAMVYGHPDGIEVNGVVAHRVDYSMGWVASSVAETDPPLQKPNSQDAYAHVGFKVGGISLDGEGDSGIQKVNPKRPWEETALTLDAFGYHGLTRLDDGSGTGGIQDDNVNVIGGAGRLQVASFTMTGGAYAEHHSKPYQGDPGNPGDPAAVPPVPAVAPTTDTNSATAVVAFDELAYVIYPWLVPALRAEYTHLTVDTLHGGGTASMLRIAPSVAVLFRPNIKLAVIGDIDRAVGGPPTGAWDPTGATIAAQAPGKSKLHAERVLMNLSFAF